MGRLFLVHPEGKTYNCKFCDAKLGHVGSLVSKISWERFFPSWILHDAKGFTLQQWKSILFNKVVNITFGENEERTLLSGTYTVKDIYCRICGQILGWKYEKSHEESQKYNEGKFVLDRVKIIDDDDDEFYIDTRSSSSDDEDEDTVYIVGA